MLEANLTAVRSTLYHNILNTLRNGARGVEYVRIMSGASKAENNLVCRAVLLHSTEGNRRVLSLSRLGEAFLMAANATLVGGGAQ